MFSVVFGEPGLMAITALSRDASGWRTVAHTDDFFSVEVKCKQKILNGLASGFGWGS